MINKREAYSDVKKKLVVKCIIILKSNVRIKCYCNFL